MRDPNIEEAVEQLTSQRSHQWYSLPYKQLAGAISAAFQLSDADAALPTLGARFAWIGRRLLGATKASRLDMRLLTISCALASLSMTSPAFAQTGEAARPTAVPAPVTISVCSGGINSIEFVEIATYDVTFRNTTSVPADEIRLSARYGRHEKRAAFDLKGPFAPGADISRHLRRTVSGGLFANWSDHNDCTVDYVRFSNGTTWNRDSYSAARGRQ